MPEEYIDLLSEIAGKESEGQDQPKHGKFRTSIITAYSAYLPFYENVVLRRLLASGCRYNILLVDAHDLARSLQDPTRMPRLAGRGYILAPILAGGAFHPKIVMLLGDHNARVLVGSHNTTISGFGYNRELTSRIDLGRGFKGEYRSFFQQAWAVIEEWTNHQQDYIPQKLIDSILRIGADRSPWLKGAEAQTADTIFLASLPEGESLWEKTLPYLPKRPDQVIVVGPFFDRAGAFIKRLFDDSAPDRVAIGVDAEADNISLCKQENLPSNVSFHNATDLVGDVEKRKVKKPGYLHAKALFFSSPGEQSVLITGSANPSAPAWLATPDKRNAEAIVLHRGDKAEELARSLGLSKIPELPQLGAEEIEEIYANSLSHNSMSALETSRRALVAEVIDEGLFIPGNLISLEDVSVCKIFFEDSSVSETHDFSQHAKGFIVEFEKNNLSIAKVVLVLTDGNSYNLFVHSQISINKLATTSKQQTFHDALASLEGDSPDFATLFRITDRLIFDEGEKEAAKAKVIVSKSENHTEKDDEESLGALSVPLEETKHQQRRRREIHHGDLAFVIDALIYNLGIGLQDAAERTEDHGLSEEEQVGEEGERQQDYAPEIKKDTLLKVCHGKVHSLVNRMCKRLNDVEPDTPEAFKAIEQLLAVMAVLREVRANDLKLIHVTEGETLVPLKERKKLLESTLKSLFGYKKDLFDRTALCFKDDPENDMARLLGLITWLAWDSGLNVRSVKFIPSYEHEARREALHELSRLFVIALRAGKFTDAFAEANHSAWRVCKVENQQEMTLWMHRYERWAKEIYDLTSDFDANKSDLKPECGLLAIAINEPSPRPRVVIGNSNNKVHLSEFGSDKHSEVVFLASAVRALPMPVF